MRTAYRILPSGNTSTLPQTLSPCHKLTSFSQEIHRNASGKERRRQIRKAYIKNETEGNESSKNKGRQDKLEVLVR